MSTPLELFCCYAREDQEMLERLKKHLVPLQRQGQIIIWSDTNLHAGVEWEKELHRHLESADIILLLISPDFMNSEYCYSTEMKRAIQRHEQNNARVIPILLRPTYWKGAPFEKLQMLPTNAKPVKNWPSDDDAFHDITEQVNRVVSERQIQHALVEADGHAHAGRYQEALACYEQILRLDSANGPALSGKARTLSQLGKRDANMEAFPLANVDESTVRDALAAPLGKSGEQRERRTRQKERTMHDQPSTSNQGDIHILAPITGGVVGIGHGGNISANNISQGTRLSLDRATLKASLQELFGELGSAGLPAQVQMEAQTATGQAAQQVEAPTLQVAALAQHLQHVGQSLQQAKVAVEKGSRLATAVLKIAHILGPVVGGPQIVAGWFGLPLP